MIVHESNLRAQFPQLEDSELEHLEEMRQQAIALMYGWA